MTATPSSTPPPCPECGSEYTYEMPPLLVCPECAHEWPADSAGGGDDNDDDNASDGAHALQIRDSVGNVLADGDTVVVVKDLKVKGGAGPNKVGTKVRNIRLVDGPGDHDIDCRVDGFGPMHLKSSVVKKA